MCRRIEENSCRSRINIDCFTDGNTDGIVLSVFHRELEKNYGLVPQFPTESPTASPTEITDEIVPSVFHRVGKKITGLCHNFRRNHRRKSHIPKRTPVRGTITDGIVGGKFPSVISDEITDG